MPCTLTVDAPDDFDAEETLLIAAIKAGFPCFTSEEVMDDDIDVPACLRVLFMAALARDAATVLTVEVGLTVPPALQWI